MDITPAMLRAARTTKFIYYQQNRLLGSQFVPIPDGQLLAILEAAIGAIGEDEPPEAAEPPGRDSGEGEVYAKIPTEKRPAIQHEAPKWQNRSAQRSGAEGEGVDLSWFAPPPVASVQACRTFSARCV